jgi:hypothetical protein
VARRIFRPQAAPSPRNPPTACPRSTALTQHTATQHHPHKHGACAAGDCCLQSRQPVASHSWDCRPIMGFLACNDTCGRLGISAYAPAAAFCGGHTTIPSAVANSAVRCRRLHTTGVRGPHNTRFPACTGATHGHSAQPGGVCARRGHHRCVVTSHPLLSSWPHSKARARCVVRGARSHACGHPDTDGACCSTLMLCDSMLCCACCAAAGCSGD